MTVLTSQQSWFRCLSVLVLALFLAGCSNIGKSLEDRDPNLKRAKERRAVGDYTGALEQYEKALEKRPGAARIHWDMATIYDQHLTNELRAIYHYERYLELEPKAERRKLVEQSIGLAKLSYAVSLPDRPSDAVQEISRLRREMDTLRTLLTESREETARAREEVMRLSAPVQASGRQEGSSVASASSDTRPVTVDAPKPALAKPVTFDTYVVQPGDTLSRIAIKKYNDANKWNDIYQANRNILKRPESVRIGQTLVIPR